MLRRQAALVFGVIWGLTGTAQASVFLDSDSFVHVGDRLNFNVLVPLWASGHVQGHRLHIQSGTKPTHEPPIKHICKDKIANYDWRSCDVELDRIYSPVRGTGWENPCRVFYDARGGLGISGRISGGWVCKKINIGFMQEGPSFSRIGNAVFNGHIPGRSLGARSGAPRKRDLGTFDISNRFLATFHGEIAHNDQAVGKQNHRYIGKTNIPKSWGIIATSLLGCALVWGGCAGFGSSPRRYGLSGALLASGLFIGLFGPILIGR